MPPTAPACDESLTNFENSTFSQEAMTATGSHSNFSSTDTANTDIQVLGPAFADFLSEESGQIVGESLPESECATVHFDRPNLSVISEVNSRSLNDNPVESTNSSSSLNNYIANFAQSLEGLCMVIEDDATTQIPNSIRNSNSVVNMSDIEDANNLEVIDISDSSDDDLVEVNRDGASLPSNLVT
jgi:hypothetical protein